MLGIASWEGKFIMASLEEHGWKADAHFNVSPLKYGIVTQGPPAPQIDTAHYSVVIALDTSAAKYAGAIESFVRQGGGFIATGGAAGLPAFASILPGTLGAPIPIGDQQSFDLDSLTPKNALALAPIRQLKPNAVPVETRGKDVAAAAWRVRDGRVLQVGYMDTWRWRMGGIVDPVGQYRHWWSMMTSSVAYAPRYAKTVAGSVEPTPMASLVKILGSPKPQKVEKASLWDDPRLLPALFTLLMVTFLLEWASRRLRGRP
jgi:hypothetical protein